jgi:CRP-like cAMP-binding protein
MPHYEGPQNPLLRAAIDANRPYLSRRLKRIVYGAGEQFWKQSNPIPYALFPIRGIISIRLSTVANRLIEVAIIGPEGFVGLPLFFGLDYPISIPIALTAGEAVLMPADVYQAYCRGSVFRDAVERFIAYHITMLGYISLCSRVHTFEQSFAGRILLIHDRILTDSFQVTQEQFSQALGVRRATVSQVAIALRKDGAIQYDRRGRIIIVNRHKLEKHACSCYQNMKAVFELMLRSASKD